MAAIDDSKVYVHPLSALYKIENFEKEVTAKIPVFEEGANDYKLIATDLAGNTTEVEFSITKEE
ncbi:hypothetical protein [Planomicrobium sp. CPCC 101079]|uniref:hypothetical protein n=1 Tax=Planomicrobium sp. CPCC 101079 TaxID=2599618 RepID=UPI0011B45B96|nr:hypothetical protein [Planomicrobium sp. CPCC 101079]TWT03570.1 hypothetical protein FQV28_11150 [Planomicrobium sp. CPCC 101079]